MEGKEEEGKRDLNVGSMSLQWAGLCPSCRCLLAAVVFSAVHQEQPWSLAAAAVVGDRQEREAGLPLYASRRRRRGTGPSPPTTRSGRSARGRGGFLSSTAAYAGAALGVGRGGVIVGVGWGFDRSDGGDRGCAGERWSGW
jgi:hypothetical protein